MYVCMYVCLYVCMYVRMYVCICVFMHACMYVCMHSMYLCMYDMYLSTCGHTFSNMTKSWWKAPLSRQVMVKSPEPGLADGPVGI